MRILCFIFLSVSLLLSCNSRNKKDIPGLDKRLSESEMLVFFQKHRTQIDTLCNWMYRDRKKLGYMPPMTTDKLKIDDYGITKQEVLNYTELLDSISMSSVVCGNLLDYNSVILYFNNVTEQGIDVHYGFEYRVNEDTVYEDWVLADGDLFETAVKEERGVFVYKPIQSHWNIVMLLFDKIEIRE